MVCPPLDALQSSEVYQHESSYNCMMNEMRFAPKLSQLVPSEEDPETLYSKVLPKVAEYMNRKHNSNYIVYNLFRER